MSRLRTASARFVCPFSSSRPTSLPTKRHIVSSRHIHRNPPELASTRSINHADPYPQLDAQSSHQAANGAPTSAKESNAVRTLDRLASALRQNQVGQKNVKLSRLRGGGFWADRHLAGSKDSDALQETGEASSAPSSLTSMSSPDIPATRKMQDSYIEVELPFESDAALLEAYIGAFTSVRVGRIMEDLDSLAGSIAYKHVLPDGASSSDAAKSGLYVVTAAVDRLDMLRPLSSTDPEDLRLSGHVYSTGNSTVEITVRLQSVSRSRGLQDSPETILLGRFTMACRDSKTGKAKRVPQLVTESSDEKRLEEMGKEQRVKKMKALKNSLDVNPPNAEESVMLHNLFSKYSAYYQPGAATPKEVVWMKKGTQLSSILMCHPQERNVHGNIFGGYLMRLAFEAAYSTGCLFADGPVVFLALDELAFKNPVTVGSLLQLTTAVTFSPIQNYSSHKSFQVSVEAATISLHTGKRLVTNVFHYTFASQDPLNRFVLPEDYSDGLKWLESMRRRETGRELRKLYKGP